MLYTAEYSRNIVIGYSLSSVNIYIYVLGYLIQLLFILQFVDYGVRDRVSSRFSVCVSFILCIFLVLDVS